MTHLYQGCQPPSNGVHNIIYMKGLDARKNFFRSKAASKNRNGIGPCYPLDNQCDLCHNAPIMSLQVVKASQTGFAQTLAKLNLYAELTGKTIDQCVIEALTDYVDTVVAAKISHFEKLEGIAV